MLYVANNTNTDDDIIDNNIKNGLDSGIVFSTHDVTLYNIYLKIILDIMK